MDAADRKPFFLITVDTEGDDFWAKPRSITTRNAAFLLRFQSLCESFGFKPTYLTDYEMAQCPIFREFARNVLKRQTAEIGMHLHAWNTPPLDPLTSDDYECQPYLIEYPEQAIKAKVHRMTALLEDTFQVKMRCHRAGRWSFNEVYACALLENGYQVDCSVTPRFSWKPCMGSPEGNGGTDFTGFPEDAYFINLADISQPGDSELLEVPLTVVTMNPSLEEFRRRITKISPLRRGLNHFFPRNAWLWATSYNGKNLAKIALQVVSEGRRYAQFTIHSSELMPGGSPNFPQEGDIEELYWHLETLLDTARVHYQPATMSEFHAAFCREVGR